MSELVELGDGVVYRMEIEVSRDVVGLHIVGRMLNGTEVEHLVRARNNDHSSRVLTGCALNAGAALREPLDLSLVAGYPALLEVFLRKADCGFFRDSRARARLEYVVLAEKLFGVAVRF